MSFKNSKLFEKIFKIAIIGYCMAENNFRKYWL